MSHSITDIEPATLPQLVEAPEREIWQQLVDRRSPREAEVLARAWDTAVQAHSGQTRASGEPYASHALAVARILAGLRMDHETLVAAILHDVVEDTDLTLEDIQARFGAGVAHLVDGVTKMDQLQVFREESGQAGHEHVRAESLRKMLLAMAEDVRVVLIKLADRLHNMRTLSSLPEEKRKRIARETMDILAPLANRLGIWQIKWELEDLSLRYLEPETYHQIAAMLAEKRVDRERYVERFAQKLKEELDAAGVKADVYGRPKHIFGINKKMKRKGKDFHEIYDVRAVRIVTDDIQGCYAALGIVHTLWQYIPGEFDDYIATPKENNYRSIHTAVIGPEGKTVEVQIRTRDMHRLSEYGVAAHWRYKEGKAADASFDEKINWLRQLLEWKDEVAEASDFVDQFKSEVFSDRVYVFTPMGNVIDLPQGATPVDFAYAIHTEVGNRCRGAKVNGHIVPLSYHLRTGEQVDILTIKKGGPSRDWLNTNLGYLQTSKARSKVQQWFRLQDHEKNVASGRVIIEKELKRLGYTDIALENLAHSAGFPDADAFFAAVGRSEVKGTQIYNAINKLVAPDQSGPAVESIPVAPAREGRNEGAVAVQGIGNLLTQMAGCCKPVPGDQIVGFITRGRGVTVHRRDCRNILRLNADQPERLLEVSWGSKARHTYPVDIQIIAYDRHGLLRDITGLLADEKLNVIAVNTLSDKSKHLAKMHLTLEVEDLASLGKALVRLEQLPNVLEVFRDRSR